MIVCFVAAVVSNATYGLAKSRATLYAGIVLGSITGMAFPTFSAIKANNVSEAEQGRIQGALYSILAVAAGLGPVSIRWVDHAISSFPGAMFLFAALVQLIAAFLACYLPKDRSNSRDWKRRISEDESQVSAGEELAVLSQLATAS